MAPMLSVVFSSGTSGFPPHRPSRALAALAAVAVAAAPCAACSGGEVPKGSRIVVTVPPLAFFVERLAGERVDVSVLIPPGATPESYAPSVRQLRDVSRASLLIEVGHPGLAWERVWMDGLTRDAGRLRIVDGSAGCDRRGGDPHVWLSPACARIIARNVARALSRLHPDAAPQVKVRLQALEAGITRIDRDARVRLGPYAGRTFLVFHPAWGRFASEYGLRQLAIEPGHGVDSARRIARVLDFARRDSIHTVFAQPQFARASADLVAEEIGGRVVELDPLARNWAAGMHTLVGALAQELRR